MTPSSRARDRLAYGFLGGTFDPVQKAHVALARAALRERHLARVFLVPTSQSPLKNDAMVSARERAALVRAAVRGQPGLAVGAWEVDQKGPVYTHRTLERLREKFPGRRWELILGEDSWRLFRRWRRWKDILAHVPLVVGRRGGKVHSSRNSGPPAFFLKAHLPPFSSTEVRDALTRGRSVSQWVPSAAVREIKRRQLYRPRWSEGGRPQHALAVARMAQKLARRHGADPQDAEIAGLFHDVAKYWPADQLVSYVRRYRVPVPDLKAILKHGATGLLHGFVAAHLSATWGKDFNQAVRTAMARHTVGHPDMGLLDQILYVADFASADRHTEDAVAVRRLAGEDLTAALREAVRRKMNFVMHRGRYLHPATVALWNRLCASAPAGGR